MPEGITAFYSLVVLLVLWLIAVFLWKTYRITKLRQELFDLRGDLFDLVLVNKDLSYHHPAYLRLRNTLNSVIRFAHRMTFVRFLSTLIAYRFFRKNIRGGDGWQASLEGLPSEVQGEFHRIGLQMHLAVLSHVLRMPVSLVRMRSNRSGKNNAASDAREQVSATIRELERQAVEEREGQAAKRPVAYV